MRRAVYPGSFDPITNGHVDLVKRASLLFDEVLVAIADNPNKQALFSHAERMEMAQVSLAEIPTARVIVFRGLLSNLYEKEQCCAIIRGLRAVSDFEYEFQMALMNRKQLRRAETVFLMPSLRWVYLSSNLIKEVARHKGAIKDLVPEIVCRKLRETFGSK
ncbi:MAG: pantetheine-phosphate adenylyltransferase [Candidatus Zixiibacteriota bacterium]|nr:MAG: pantetheine-phosphate adenylyltransferase [candidate division Zixibacteria bacterium]